MTICVYVNFQATHFHLLLDILALLRGMNCLKITVGFDWQGDQHGPSAIVYATSLVRRNNLEIQPTDFPICSNTQWRCGSGNFHLGELQPSGSVGPYPSGIREWNPDGVLGTKSPSSWSSFADVAYRFRLAAETIKIWTFRTIHVLILDQYVSRRGGISDITGGLSP